MPSFFKTVFLTTILSSLAIAILATPATLSRRNDNVLARPNLYNHPSYNHAKSASAGHEDSVQFHRQMAVAAHNLKLSAPSDQKAMYKADREHHKAMEKLVKQHGPAVNQNQTYNEKQAMHHQTVTQQILDGQRPSNNQHAEAQAHYDRGKEYRRAAGLH